MKNRLVYAFFTLLFTGLTIGVIPVVNAMAADLLPPQMTIDHVSEQMKFKLKDEQAFTDFASVTAIVEEIIYPHVDFNRVSALVLGKHWRTASKEQKLRFRKEFQTLLVRTYARAFTEFTNWEVKFLPIRMKEGSSKVIVKTQVLQSNRKPVEVDYRMRKDKKGDWKVYDIIIEGVSLVTNYRNSFKNEIQRSGSLDDVIDQMAKRNEKALAKPVEQKS